MTISEEQRTRILSLFYAEHWKVGTIASELGLHPDTVSSAIGTDTFVSRGPRARSSKLEPYTDLIELTLKLHPRLRATRLYDMLTPRGFEGASASSDGTSPRSVPSLLPRRFCASIGCPVKRPRWTGASSASSSLEAVSGSFPAS